LHDASNDKQNGRWREATEEREDRKDVEVVLHDLSMREQLQELSENSLDIGFAIAPPFMENLVYERLLDCTMIAVLPKNHILAHHPQISLAALARESWIWFPRHLNPHYHDQNMRFCQQAGFKPRIIQETNQPHVMTSLVAAGLGVAMMSGWTQSLERRGIVYRKFQEASWQVDLQIMVRKKEASPFIGAFLAIARQVSAQFSLPL
jgi:DNA-binding transcriptional LysR family regulator